MKICSKLAKTAKSNLIHEHFCTIYCFKLRRTIRFFQIFREIQTYFATVRNHKNGFDKHYFMITYIWLNYAELRVSDPH
jgi:hypothetical protein